VRGLFVTGTDTGVGKTILSAALLAAMSADGESVRAHKPVVTGLDVGRPDVTGSDVQGPEVSGLGERRPNDWSGGWPPDHELLAAAAGMDPLEVAPLRYGPAVSPHLAAALAGERIEPAGLLAAARNGVERWLVVEGVGGLLTPLAEDFTVRDLAAALGLPVLLAARPGLGTINHTLLTLQAARAARLDVRAVVLTPWPQRPSQMERSNRETIARLGDVEVEVLGRVHQPDRADLGRAGAGLPWRRWIYSAAPTAVPRG
jgi:dethiobiotin synthetase